jgi:hypothetical protein
MLRLVSLLGIACLAVVAAALKSSSAAKPSLLIHDSSATTETYHAPFSLN